MKKLGLRPTFIALLGILFSAGTDAVGFKPDPVAGSGVVLNQAGVVSGAAALPQCQESWEPFTSG